jgi:hypothetical protein
LNGQVFQTTGLGAVATPDNILDTTGQIAYPH